MIVSTKFLKDYVDIDVDLKTLAEDMTKAGNEYDSAEKWNTTVFWLKGMLSF